ncbi:hypothetical protein EDD36DRAFT_402912 [Exophiala viscosa]|uniref:Carrier domain-containing protein n=1 Tax=Exophiala viscosa TaxID=2486360 RepID=A0AAN6E119_9EURO|nr:hypothetical protein EDD36DRAFT_402912 [Exophiala viscosa]
MDDSSPVKDIGKRLLPQVVDSRAKKTPGRVFTSTPRTLDLHDGFYDVTYAELAHLVNYMAWWIEREMGRGEMFETLGYMGATDFRYIVAFLAAIKCGYKLFVPSSRNSLSGNLSLFHELHCVKFIYTADIYAKAVELRENKPDLKLFEAPSHHTMLEGNAEHYPYNKTYAEAEHDEIFVCHTSGTTGAPKPITVNNGHFTTFDNLRKLPKVEGRENLDYSSLEMNDSGRYYSPFPPFHMGGMLTTGIIPIWYDTPVVVGPPGKPPSGDILSQVIKLQPNLRALMTPPTPIEQLLNESGGSELAGRMDFVLYGGGPLSPSVGNRLRKVTKVAQLIGSTELGMVPLLFPGQDTWNFFEWHPNYKLEMQRLEDNIYEMVVPYDPSFEWICRVNQVPAKQEWRTRDLFEPHPTKSGLWRFYGRRDDVIVLSTGEKFNPVTMEGIILGHPLVRGALISGTARFQACLIIELRPGHHGKQDDLEERIIDSIWPYIELANNDGPATGRIFRSKIILACSEKPFARSGKGTVIRSLTEKLYAEELETLYSGAESHIHVTALNNPCSFEDIQKFLRRILISLLDKPDLSDDQDFFTLGLDSLQTSEIVNAIKAGLEHYKSNQASISIKVIYANPTVDKLTAWMGSITNPSINGLDENTDVESLRVQAMSKMVEKYTKDLPTRNTLPTGLLRTKSSSSGEPICVALTGSTGTLGMNLLQILLLDSNVSKIYCLNRALDAEQRHTKAFQERGLPNLLNGNKAVFLEAKFGDPHFGQSPETYKLLQRDVDVIIHNAWKVNFHHQLESFEHEHVRGVKYIIDWSVATNAHVFFVSSISSIAHHFACFPGAKTVPETPLEDYRTAKDLGYGESKHVAERMLQIANEKCGVKASNLRVAQVAGPTTSDGGVWNRHEYIPALVQTSLELGAIPISFQAIDWTPVDVMAQIIVDIMHTGFSSNTATAFHLVNPHVVAWKDFVCTTQEFYSSRKKIEAVPLAEWIRMLQKVDATDQLELHRKPAVKILDFFEDIEVSTRGAVSARHEVESQKLEQWLDTGNGVRASDTMAQLRPMDGELFRTWLRQWDS